MTADVVRMYKVKDAGIFFGYSDISMRTAFSHDVMAVSRSLSFGK